VKAIPTAIPDVLVIEPAVFGDARGFFFESWNRRAFGELLGRDVAFVQDNHSASAQGVLRGLHYQVRQPQGKLVRVVSGEVFDVAVDLRRASGTFGKWVAERLSAENHRMMWVPPGFAHGFLVLSERAEFLYKTTDYYAPEHERTLLWNDPALGIPWPVRGEPVLKPRDAAGVRLADAETFP
jgi:dTDP-4-dehydrorhamnose 3,5-epimerase